MPRAAKLAPEGPPCGRPQNPPSRASRLVPRLARLPCAGLTDPCATGYPVTSATANSVVDRREGLEARL